MTPLHGAIGGSGAIEFSAHDSDIERCEHDSRVLTRFDYPRAHKARERGVVLAYLRHTSG